jgi:hypothetical protein
MASTSYTDSTFSASIIGARTDNAGGAVTDTTAEEARLLAQILTAGYLTPTSAFLVQQQTVPNMTVKIGSGTAKTDYYVLSGTVGGQGNYIARLDVTSQNVTVPAADASQTRTDEVYLVIQDNLYDTSARALPRIGYRTGTLGGANPGPDGTWTAYALLARIAVAAAATSVVTANISDQRIKATVLSNLSSTPVTLADAATISTNAALGTYFRVTLGGNRTLANPTGATDGQKILWEVIQDGTGGRTITLGANFALGSTISSATLSGTAGKRDFLGAIYNSATGLFYVTALVEGY